MDWCWNSNTLPIWYEELTLWKRSWCWERLKAGGEGDDRGWDGWTASLTWWTWVWANFRSWWWTGKPDVLQSIGSQRVGHNCTTEPKWTELFTTEAHAQSVQSCPILCNPMDCRWASSSVHGISQARTLEWLPFPSPGNLPKQGIKPTSSAAPSLASGFFTTEPPRKPHCGGEKSNIS